MSKLFKIMGFAGLMALGLSTAAWAGYKVSTPVIVSPTAHYAFGAMGTARNSADATQFIGCRVMSMGSGNPMALCFARDTNGTYGACSSTDPLRVALVAAINPDSFIFFQFDPGTGACTSLEIENASYYEPKGP